MSPLTLEIRPLAFVAGWTGSWMQGGRSLGAPIAVEGARAVALREVESRFAALFGSGTSRDARRSLIDGDELRGLGERLREIWLGPLLDRAEEGLDGSRPHDLLVRSSDPKILNLPWELIELRAGLPLGCDEGWALRRMTMDARDAGDVPLAPGPLRILFLAAAPRDQERLFHEREEEAILDATAALPERVVLHFSETGAIGELAELVAECRPHIVHLSGHGKVDESGQGGFAFEDERGRTDMRPGAELVARVFRGSSVRCVFFNSCESAHAAAAGLCQSLVAVGLPLAIGWSGRVEDGRATEFACEFYHHVVRGEPVTPAAAHAREAVRRGGPDHESLSSLRDATFAMPQVYGSAVPAVLFDASLPAVPYVGPRSEPFLLGDGIVGLKSGFIGRRREGQRLFPALREGEVTFTVIQGLGGVGKSTLATRAANRLAGLGFRVVAVRAPTGPTPQDVAANLLLKLREALDRAFQSEGRPDLHRLLTNEKINPGDQLLHAVNALNELRLALVIDDLENALELEGGEIADPMLAMFYSQLARNLTRGSRVLVTSRYLPAQTPIGQPTVLHLHLPELDESDFIKFLRSDRLVEDRMLRGELPTDALSALYRSLGGTPGFVEQLRALLRSDDIEELVADLEEDGTDLIEEAREGYLQKILAQRLLEQLSEASRGLVGHLAVSELPLPVEAFAPVMGREPPQAQRDADEGVAVGVIHRFEEENLPPLYQVPGLLRSWLQAVEPLPESSALTAHLRLASFWRQIRESDGEERLRVHPTTGLLACLEHARQGGDSETEVWATLWFARILEYGHGDLRSALRCRDLITDLRPASSAYWESARVRAQLGDFKGAELALEIALRLASSADERYRALHLRGVIAARKGNAIQAKSDYEKCLLLQPEGADPAERAEILLHLAQLATAEGDHARADSLASEATDLYRHTGDSGRETEALLALADASLDRGKIDEARRYAARCLSLSQSTGSAEHEAQSLLALAHIEEVQGSLPDAHDYAQRSLALFDKIDEPDWADQSRIALAEIQMALGRGVQALETAQVGLERYESIGNESRTTTFLFLIGRIYLSKRECKKAGEVFPEVIRFMAERSDMRGLWAVYETIGRFAVETGRDRDGLILLSLVELLQLPESQETGDDRYRGLGMVAINLGYNHRESVQAAGEALEAYRADLATGVVMRVLTQLPPLLGRIRRTGRHIREWTDFFLRELGIRR
jgi:tetratricopeptide (TPR) repeat protein